MAKALALWLVACEMAKVLLMLCAVIVGKLEYWVEELLDERCRLLALCVRCLLIHIHIEVVSVRFKEAHERRATSPPASALSQTNALFRNIVKRRARMASGYRDAFWKA
jgi:hypothetical protein